MWLAVGLTVLTSGTFPSMILFTAFWTHSRVHSLLYRVSVHWNLVLPKLRVSSSPARWELRTTLRWSRYKLASWRSISKRRITTLISAWVLWCLYLRFLRIRWAAVWSLCFFLEMFSLRGLSPDWLRYAQWLSSFKLRFFEYFITQS